MLNVTERALDQLETLRTEANAEPGQGVTLVVQESGELGFALAHPGETDTVLDRDGEPVMIVPQPLIEPLDGVTLDFVEEGTEGGFVLGREEEAAQ